MLVLAKVGCGFIENAKISIKRLYWSLVMSLCYLSLSEVCSKASVTWFTLIKPLNFQQTDLETHRINVMCLSMLKNMNCAYLHKLCHYKAWIFCIKLYFSIMNRFSLFLWYYTWETVCCQICWIFWFELALSRSRYFLLVLVHRHFETTDLLGCF